MNSLSFLIYAISTLSQLQNFLAFIIIASGVAIVGLLISIAISLDQYNFSNGQKYREKAWSWVKRSVIFLVSAAFLVVFVPNEKYLVLIAASQVGEMVINQPQFKDAVGSVAGLSGDATNLLKLYIQDETKKLIDDATKTDKK